MQEIETHAQQVGWYALQNSMPEKSRGTQKHGRMSSVLQIAFIRFRPSCIEYVREIAGGRLALEREVNYLVYFRDGVEMHVAAAKILKSNGIRCHEWQQATAAAIKW